MRGVVFLSNNLPPFRPKYHSIHSLAFGYTAFVKVVMILGQNLLDLWELKEVKLFFNYSRIGPVYLRRTYLTALYASDFRISRQKASQPFVAEGWLAMVWVGDPGGEGSYFKMGYRQP